MIGLRLSGVETQVFKLPVQGRAAYLQPPGDLGHLAAIMVNGEPDRLQFHRFQRTDLTLAIEQCKRAMRGRGGERIRPDWSGWKVGGDGGCLGGIGM